MQSEVDLVRLLLGDLEETGWEVDYAGLFGTGELAYSESDVMKCSFAFDPSDNTVAMIFSAEARYSIKSKAKRYLSRLTDTLKEQKIKLLWEKPRTIKVMWTVTRPCLFHQRSTTALRNVFTNQQERGVRLLVSCLSSLRICASEKKRKKRGLTPVSSSHLIVFTISEPSGAHKLH